MKLLFTEEVTNEKELEDMLQEKEIPISNYRIGVIALLTDEEERFLLQRRGPKSRDEQFKLEQIGGRR